MSKYNLPYMLVILVIFALITGCNKNSLKGGKNSSQATGWKINSKDGGFQSAAKYKGQPAGPGLIFYRRNRSNQ